MQRKITANWNSFVCIFLRAINEHDLMESNLRVIALDIDDGRMQLRHSSELYDYWNEIANFMGITESPIDEDCLKEWYNEEFCERFSYELSQQLGSDIVFEWEK